MLRGGDQTPLSGSSVGRRPDWREAQSQTGKDLGCEGQEVDLHIMHLGWGSRKNNLAWLLGSAGRAASC